MPLSDRHLAWLRTFRGYTEDEAELAAMAADEIERLRQVVEDLTPSEDGGYGPDNGRAWKDAYLARLAERDEAVRRLEGS